MDDNTTPKRGFAAMDEEQQRAIASQGGKVSPGNFKNNPEKARAAGRKGGLKSRSGNQNEDRSE